jgi:hypothetical protein
MKMTYFFLTLILRADKGKGKGKDYLRTGHEGSDGE